MKGIQVAGAATLVVISVISLAFAGSDARSQTARTIKIVAPFPAGGTVDILSRLLGEQISKMHGTTVIVENRPGAGDAIAYEAVARAAPISAAEPVGSRRSMT
jgi:tripartite-type tricarboxylate transporter receptor subunit TctC